MDLILNAADDYILDDVYPTWLPRDAIPRQLISLFWVMLLGGATMYFVIGSLSYLVYFKWFKEKFHPSSEPQPKPGQVQREIKLALWSMPTMALLTAPIIVFEVRGYSQLYEEIESWPYFLGSIVLFLLFTDTCIYWIHRLEHEIPFLYKYVHKPHHAWFVPTPYAALAFHPVDGWLQSLPYHIFPFMLPLQKHLYLCLFMFVQLWTISIHDGVDQTPYMIVNGTAHHTIHHSKFLYNYGQFFTFWDRIGGTHMDPYAPGVDPFANAQEDGNGAENGKILKQKGYTTKANGHTNGPTNGHANGKANGETKKIN